MPVYFIDNDDPVHQADQHGRHRCGYRGSRSRAAAFLVSEDESTFAYRVVDGSLYVYREGAKASTLIWQTHERFLMDGVSLSPDNAVVAFGGKATRPRNGVSRP